MLFCPQCRAEIPFQPGMSREQAACPACHRVVRPNTTEAGPPIVDADLPAGAMKCPECGGRFMLPAATSKHVECPHCQAAVTRPPPRPRGEEVERPRAISGQVVPTAVLKSANWAVLISVIGWLLICGGTLGVGRREYLPDFQFVHRFKTDNATGAAANAVEFLAKQLQAIRPGEVIIAGLLVLVIAELRRRPLAGG